jgi:hypothetical protein
MDSERLMIIRGRPVGILPANFVRYAAASLLGLLIAVAMMIVSRRAAGALENTLDPATLAITGAIVAAAAAAIRLGWFSSADTRRGPLDWAVMLLTSLSVAALGAGLCLSGSPVHGMFLLCTLLLAEESWAWAWHIRHCFEPATPTPQRMVRLDAAHAAMPRTGRSGSVAHAIATLDPEMPPLSEAITQQLTRSQAADGTEELCGWLRL